MERESFVFYGSFYEAIKVLPRDVQGEIYTAIMEYSLYGREIEDLKQIAKAVFTLIKPQLDANNKRFENGKKGGRPPKEITEQKPNDNQTITENKPKNNQTETKPKPNVNVNVNDNVLKEKDTKVSKKKTEVFTPPTVQEVESYCLERNNDVDAQRFIDYYQSVGWVVGKNKKMKDWQATVRRWEKEDKKKGGQYGQKNKLGADEASIQRKNELLEYAKQVCSQSDRHHGTDT